MEGQILAYLDKKNQEARKHRYFITAAAYFKAAEALKAGDPAPAARVLESDRHDNDSEVTAMLRYLVFEHPGANKPLADSEAQ